MPASEGVKLHGLREMQRAFRAADKELAKDLRKSLAKVAEPVRADAEQRARRHIRNIGPRWSRMRTGVLTKLVYVAPKERGRGSRTNSALRRPNLAGLLMDRAMEPALEAHSAGIEHEIDAMLGELADKWAHHG